VRVTFFLNQIQPYGLADNIREQTRKSLQNNIVGHFNKKSYRALSSREREVYEWLEFISCGHLMLPDDVKKIKNEYIQEAYKMSELEFASRERLQGEIPQLWTEFHSKEKLQETEKQLQDMVKIVVKNFMSVTAETIRDFSSLDAKLQLAVLTELRARNAEVTQYENVMSQPNTRPNTTEKLLK
jgi:hypothetical protein